MTNARKADDTKAVSADDAAKNEPPANAVLSDSDTGGEQESAADVWRARWPNPEDFVAEYDRVKTLTENLYKQVNGVLPREYTGEE